MQKIEADPERPQYVFTETGNRLPVARPGRDRQTHPPTRDL